VDVAIMAAQVKSPFIPIQCDTCASLLPCLQAPGPESRGGLLVRQEVDRPVSAW
jgi:hypothetical protein